jgi:hypothetical protein
VQLTCSIGSCESLSTPPGDRSDLRVGV